MKIAQMLALAMLLGSIPWGRLAANARGRTKTGDPGAGWNGLIALLDALKGFLPVYLAAGAPEARAWVAAAGAVAMLSHSFPYWFMFRPMGRGTAVGFGAVFALSPAAGACVLAMWAVVLAAARRPVLANAAGAVAAPVALRMFGQPLADVCFGLFACAYVLIAHSRQMARLIGGECGR